MKGTRQEFMEWDLAMEEYGIPTENYVGWRAKRFAQLIFNSTPAHLTLPEWCDCISKAMHDLIHIDIHPDDLEEEIKTNLDPNDPNP